MDPSEGSNMLTVIITILRALSLYVDDERWVDIGKASKLLLAKVHQEQFICWGVLYRLLCEDSIKVAYVMTTLLQDRYHSQHIPYFHDNTVHTCIPRKPLKTVRCCSSCKNKQLQRAHIYTAHRDTWWPNMITCIKKLFCLCFVFLINDQVTQHLIYLTPI